MQKLVSCGLLLFFVAGLSNVFGQENSLYQYATITSLLEGVFEGSLPVREYKTHGDFGIGTINNLDGEMLVLNDTVYQVRTDGIPIILSDDSKIPFASITKFKADSEFIFKDTVTLEDLQKILDGKLLSDNLAYAIKAEGVFRSVKLRSVPGQKKPFPRLADAVSKQAVFEYDNIKGTLLGFKVPKYMDGVNVAGYHFHFISDDRKRGGHVLDCKTGSLKFQIENIYKINLVLPSTDDFLQKKNINKNAEEVKKLEN